MRTYWSATPRWQNKTCFIVAGGPSLTDLDLSALEGRRVIAVNNAFRLIEPKVLFYADSRWWRWNKEDVPLEPTYQIISTTSAAAHVLDPRVLRMARDYRYREERGAIGLSEERHMLAGPDSGSMAINLAYHFGASRIVLLGFDMGFAPDGRAHWHGDHPIKTPETNYTQLFAPTYPRLIAALEKRGVEVIRCTPSRLDFIREMPLAEVVDLPHRERG